jgi:S-adenosyl-L-methionine hydrolase (adenosine-forming)
VSDRRKPREAVPTPTPAAAPAGAPVVTLLTDFGERDGYVGILKGVVLKFAPTARLVDLSHEIPPQEIPSAALVLESAVRFFPPKTVHLAIVDPGVGSDRRPIAIETEDFFLVGPDNGVLAPAAAVSPVKGMCELDRRELHLPEVGRTFHGRDVFAPIAARLATGMPLASVGRAIERIEPLDIPTAKARENGEIEAQVLHVDRFGNVVLNLDARDLGDYRAEDVSVTIGAVRIQGISSHYAAVNEGRPLLLWNSWGRLEIAVRNGSASRQLRVRNGDRAQVRREGR